MQNIKGMLMSTSDSTFVTNRIAHPIGQQKLRAVGHIRLSAEREMERAAKLEKEALALLECPHQWTTHWHRHSGYYHTCDKCHSTVTPGQESSCYG